LSVMCELSNSSKKKQMSKSANSDSRCLNATFHTSPGFQIKTMRCGHVEKCPYSVVFRLSGTFVFDRNEFDHAKQNICNNKI
jgi:hypothetical protein